MKRSQTYNPIWIENTIWYINTDNNNTPSTPRQKERIENTVCSCSICIANSSGVIFGIFFSCWPITIIATKATWTSNVCARKMRAKGEKPESMLEKKKNDSNNNNNKTKHITQHNAMSLSLTQKRIQKNTTKFEISVLKFIKKRRRRSNNQQKHTGALPRLHNIDVGQVYMGSWTS